MKNDAKNDKAEAKTNKSSATQKYEDMIEPIQIDGWWDREVGAVLEGTAVERAESDYGPYYKIRVSSPTKIKARGENPERRVKPGEVVAVAENALLRQLGARMRKEPTAVRLEITGERPDGRGFEMQGAWRAAY